MVSGIIAGVTWALATIFLNMALGMNPLAAATFSFLIGTFLHDTFSAIWSLIYNAIRGNLGKVWAAVKSKGGKWVIIAAVIGGPVGMTGYVMAVNFMGESIGSVSSAIFPAIGSVLAYIFLKEKMKWYQWIFLFVTLFGVYGLFFSSDLSVNNFLLGLLGALMCAFGWGIEAVILAKCLKDADITDECALQIRQTTSALTFGLVIIPIVGFIGGWKEIGELFTTNTGWLLPTIVVAGLFATVSYLFYYKAIAKIGASKAMALNITYAAWAVLFGALIDWDFSVLTNPLTVVCVIVVLVCGIFAAADFKEIFKKRSKDALEE